MSLDDIKLSPYLVKKLYENSLIDTDDNVKPISNGNAAKDDLNAVVEKNIAIKKSAGSSGETVGTIKFLGKNAKNILIIVDEKEHAFLGDDELSFLMNILNACTVSMQDVALVNASNSDDVVYENLNAQFEPSIVLFLGTEPQLLNFPVQIPQYKIQAYNNQQYLCAPSLQKLSSDKEEKKKLWMVLKVMFGI
jgi:hypothetical protein